MRIEGQYVVGGSPQLVWSLLHDPATICSTLPNCEKFDQIGPYTYVIAWQVEYGPMKGRYVGQIFVRDEAIYERFSVAFESEGPGGAIRGEGNIFLEEEGEGSVVQFEGALELVELSDNISPRLVITFANAVLRQYFEAVIKQVRIQTGIHTTQLVNEPLPQRHTGVVSLRDALAEIRQDRQTIWVVIAFLTLAIFTLTGMSMILFLLVRWGNRTYDRRVAEAVREQRSASSFLNSSQSSRLP